MIVRKTNLAYVAENQNLNYDAFTAYCSANYPEMVWRVYDDIMYCHTGNEDFLVREYRHFLGLIRRFSCYPLI